MDMAALKSWIISEIAGTEYHLSTYCTKDSDLNCRSFNEGRLKAFATVVTKINETLSPGEPPLPGSPEWLTITDDLH